MKRVGLIGSAKHPSEVEPVLRYFSSLAKITPMLFVRKLAGKSDAKLLSMFHESDAEFVRQMCLAIFKWDGLVDPNIEVVRIHGRKDPVIPLMHEVEAVIDGGHLIVMTHGAFVVASLCQEPWVMSQEVDSLG